MGQFSDSVIIRESEQKSAQATLLMGRYSFVKPLGKGGTGEVFLAEDSVERRYVAIKKVSCGGNDLLLKVAEKEVAILTRLHHPNLPKIWDSFEESGSQFLVMEYISGRDFGELLQMMSSPFLPESVFAWANTLLKILEYLHSQKPPVIHRDIKPQNIKLTEDDKIFLLDFGLAKDAPTRPSGESASRSVFGYSYHYAPLEQIKGD